MTEGRGTGGSYVFYWPFLPVNEGFSGAESDYRFVPESGRSECWDMGSSLWLLLAESGHSKSVTATEKADAKR